MEIFAGKFQEFTTLFARMLAMLSVAPVFGGQSFSYFYRVGVSFLVSLLVVPVVQLPPEFQELVASRFFILILEQVFIGLLIGLSLQFLFAAFQMAGEFFSVQMGLGISEVFDPMAQVSLPLMGIFKNLIATFVFFVSGAHLWLIRSVVFSYEKIPFFPNEILQDMVWHKGIVNFMIFVSSGMFIIALKIALPVMGTLLLVSITMGVLSKAAPQMNILMLGFPLKILIAFVVLTLVSPMVVTLMNEQFDVFFKHLDALLSSWY